MKKLFAAGALATGIMIEVGAIRAGIKLEKLDNALFKGLLIGVGGGVLLYGRK